MLCGFDMTARQDAAETQDVERLAPAFGRFLPGGFCASESADSADGAINGSKAVLDKGICHVKNPRLVVCGRQRKPLWGPSR